MTGACVAPMATPFAPQAMDHEPACVGFIETLMDDLFKAMEAAMGA